MNPKDIIAQISEKTGVKSDICEKIMNAVKDLSGGSNTLSAVGSSLLGKITGDKSGGSITAMLDEVVKKTGLPKDICEKVLKAAEENLGKSGKDILGKINPFK